MACDVLPVAIFDLAIIDNVGDYDNNGGCTAKMHGNVKCSCWSQQSYDLDDLWKLDENIDIPTDDLEAQVEQEENSLKAINHDDPVRKTPDIPEQRDEKSKTGTDWRVVRKTPTQTPQQC